MKSLPSTKVTLRERSNLTARPNPLPEAVCASMPVLFQADTATVSVINEANHASGMPVRHFNVYVTAADAIPDDLDNLEVLNMNDREFVLSVGGTDYPVQLDQIQRVHPSCVCLCLITVSHYETGRLPWYLRWFGAWMPRSMFPQPSQFFTL
jgi:hypothetical protein